MFVCAPFGNPAMGCAVCSTRREEDDGRRTLISDSNRARSARRRRCYRSLRFVIIIYIAAAGRPVCRVYATAADVKSMTKTKPLLPYLIG